MWRGCTPWGVWGVKVTMPTIEDGDVEFADELVFAALATTLAEEKSSSDENELSSQRVKSLGPASATQTEAEPQSSLRVELMHHVHQVSSH